MLARTRLAADNIMEFRSGESANPRKRPHGADDENVEDSGTATAAEGFFEALCM